eukprot:Ihof_evm5s354 gene=Ihof_evmTU5s354
MTDQIPLSRLELTFRAKNLLDLDVFSKSDPRVFVYMKNKMSNTWHEVGSTEQIDNNLNPVWSKPVVVNYYFEEVQHIRFVVYDIDNSNQGLDQQDLIGSFECTLGEIVGSKGSQLAKRLTKSGQGGGPSCGVLVVSAEEASSVKAVIKMKLKGVKLDKKDFFGKSDPFIRISRLRPDNTWAAIYSTEVVKNTLNPVWAPFEVRMQQLCNGDEDRKLKFECFDWNKSGREDVIGAFQTTLRELIEAGETKKPYTIINPSKSKKSSYRGSGSIIVEHCESVFVPTFLEYIQGGCDINLIVGIDFTASNGDIRGPTSLHYYNNQSRPNDYMQAISQVGSILQHYDSDNLYPTYGFGAQTPPDYRVSHCFALTFDDRRPEVYGIDGVMAAYLQAVTTVRLYGPTNFAPVINKAAESISCSQADQSYTILLIITDGVITDMQNTKDAIVAASSLPLSIVIVGVGKADFTEMNILDADVTPLVNRQGQKMKRDIVQFVPFREFQNSTNTGHLAEAVLEEIPDQFISYFRSKNITPNKKCRA